MFIIPRSNFHAVGNTKRTKEAAVKFDTIGM